MTTKNIELPFFAGFYESVYENSDTEYWLIDEEVCWYKDNKDMDVSPDDFEMDYSARRKAICERFCEVIKNYTPDFVNSVTFDELVSPKYYNFETDRIYANIELEDGWEDKIKEFIDTNKEWLRPIIKEEWSDRDGFWSYMSNDVDEWENKIIVEDDARYLGTMIRYMMMHDFKEDSYDCISLVECIEMEVLYEIVDQEYLIYKPEAAADEEEK